MVTNDYSLDFKPGQRVWFNKLGQQATVIEKVMRYEHPDSNYGNVIVRLEYDDGRQDIAHSWQLSRIVK
jgi:hypothetical protein